MTLREFMEDYEGFDFENETIVLFDADICKQYLISSYAYRIVYLTDERLNKIVFAWTHTENVMSIILKTPEE